MVYGKYNIITIVFMGFISQHSHHVWGHHPAVRLTGRFHSSSKVPGREMVQIPVLNTPHAPMVPMECGEYIYMYMYICIYIYLHVKQQTKPCFSRYIYIYTKAWFRLLFNVKSRGMDYIILYLDNSSHFT